MNDGRNFRSLYYEKVGCKSVEERKSLEIIFKDKTIDVNRLRQFCSRFSVPFRYRSFVWKIVFGVVPINKSSHEFVMKERESQYFDLKHGLEATNLITPDTPKENAYFQMWLLEKHSLMWDINTQMNIEFHQHLLAITRTLVGIFDSEVDVYWLAKGFFKYLKSWYEAIPSMIESTKTVLMKEDNILYSYLLETNLLNEIPMSTWFGRCFAGVLHESAVIRVWDKIIGGSYRVLVFVCSVLLTTMRRVLLTCGNISQILTCVESVSYETADIIVSKSIDMWLHQGYSVLPSPLRHPRTTPTTRLTRKSSFYH